jgi:hypothetical protein
VGDGKKIAFSTDRWIDGRSVEQLVPNLWQFVQSTTKKWMVAEALQGSRWVTVIRGAPSIPAVAEFLELLGRLSTIQLHNVEDRITWKLCNNGAYTSKSDYQAFFSGMTLEMAASQLWSAGAPLLHKLHMWLLLKNRLWTADRIARRGLEHLGMHLVLSRTRDGRTYHPSMFVCTASMVQHPLAIPAAWLYPQHKFRDGTMVD